MDPFSVKRPDRILGIFDRREILKGLSALRNSRLIPSVRITSPIVSNELLGEHCRRFAKLQLATRPTAAILECFGHTGRERRRSASRASSEHDQAIGRDVDALNDGPSCNKVVLSDHNEIARCNLLRVWNIGVVGVVGIDDVVVDRNSG